MDLTGFSVPLTFEQLEALHNRRVDLSYAQRDLTDEEQAELETIRALIEEHIQADELEDFWAAEDDRLYNEREEAQELYQEALDAIGFDPNADLSAAERERADLLARRRLGWISREEEEDDDNDNDGDDEMAIADLLAYLDWLRVPLTLRQLRFLHERRVALTFSQRVLTLEEETTLERIRLLIEEDRVWLEREDEREDDEVFAERMRQLRREAGEDVSDDENHAGDVGPSDASLPRRRL